MISTKTILALVFAAFLLCLSCSKGKDDQPITYTLSGLFIDQSNGGMGVPNIPVEVQWWDSTTRITRLMATSSTNASGRVEVPITFKAADLENGMANFVARLPPNYIAMIDGTPDNSVAYSFQRFGLQTHAQFDLYQPTPLTIHFQRTQNDNFRQMTISVASGNVTKGLHLAESPVPGQLTFNITTFAKKKTYVYWTKSYASQAPDTPQVDSVLCQPGMNNSIIVNF